MQKYNLNVELMSIFEVLRRRAKVNQDGRSLPTCMVRSCAPPQVAVDRCNDVMHGFGNALGSPVSCSRAPVGVDIAWRWCSKVSKKIGQRGKFWI